MPIGNVFLSRCLAHHPKNRLFFRHRAMMKRWIVDDGSPGRKRRCIVTRQEGLEGEQSNGFLTIIEKGDKALACPSGVDSP